MQIQSLSIDVPAGCLNHCRFCVSHMHRNDYKNLTDSHEKDYKNRLAFARDNGCNTMMFTGSGEPLLNLGFMHRVGEWNRDLLNPFRWIELQTSGLTLDDNCLGKLHDAVGVNTISLSLSDVFSSKSNAYYNRTPEEYIIDIDALCAAIKKYDYNLRLSLNLTDAYDEVSPGDVFCRAKQLQADQLTFRVLYESGRNAEEDVFVREHSAGKAFIGLINEYVAKNGRALERLPYGAVKYSVDGISTVVDADCMSTSASDVMKYLILRPNCKLYSRWDDTGSLVF